MSWSNLRRLSLVVVIGILVILTAAACSSDSEPETRVFKLEIKDGALTAEDPVLRVKRDDQVVLRITSDVTAEFHVHVLDHTVMTDPEATVELTFAASAEGGFPITIHPLESGGEEHGEDGASEDDHGEEEEQEEEEEIRIGSLEVSPR